MDQIEEFIKRRFSSSDANWQDGNCYYFAIILCNRFPHLKIYYEPIKGHFVAGTPSTYYDSLGKNFDNQKPILLDEIKEKDTLWYERIIRDCVM